MAKRSRRKTTDEDEDLFAELDEPFKKHKTAVEQKLKKEQWPEEVPILGPEDICYNFSFNNDRHDLMVWLEDIFGDTIRFQDSYHLPRRAAQAELEKVLAERTGQDKVDLWFFLENSHKDRFPPFAWIAGCWNEAMHRLGYGIPKADRRCNDDGLKWGEKCVDSHVERKPRQGPGLAHAAVARPKRCVEL